MSATKPSASATSVANGRVKDKKGHVCPPSDAKHPSDRWETAFVYAFITRFTNLRAKVEGFENPADLEDALLAPTQHPVLVQILSRFVLNLKPQTRNLNPDQLSTTLSAVLQEHLKTSERTVFWDDEFQINMDPLHGVQGGIWGADWDLKLRILRQLVELQLVQNTEIREIIDRAWGVVHNKHRKREGPTAPPDPTDPHSMERLSTIPLGQDNSRRRYWAFDDSPRLYASTNPWKVSAEFTAVATTREEYVQVIDDLKAKAPEKPKKKPSKVESLHSSLITLLESRLEVIDLELARVQKIRRKIEQRELLKVQAELRTTRTRRQTHRPDYVYDNDLDEEDDGDEYKYQDDEDEEHEPGEEEYDEEFGGMARRRRSSRASAKNANGKRTSDALGGWRGERRSSRLGPGFELPDDEPSTKRARTEERSVSSAVSDTLVSPVLSTNGTALPKKNGAAAVRSNEVAVDQVPGKKKSKFWFYAVEPAPNAVTSLSSQTDGAGISNPPELQNGGGHSGGIIDRDLTGQHGNDRAPVNRLSPTSTMGSA